MWFVVLPWAHEFLWAGLLLASPGVHETLQTETTLYLSSAFSIILDRRLQTCLGIHIELNKDNARAYNMKVEEVRQIPSAVRLLINLLHFPDFPTTNRNI